MKRLNQLLPHAGTELYQWKALKLYPSPTEHLSSFKLIGCGISLLK